MMLTKAELDKAVGEKLQREQESKKLTQRDLAAKAGLDPSTISNCESGKGLCVYSAIRISRALGRSWSYLLSGIR